MLVLNPIINFLFYEIFKKYAIKQGDLGTFSLFAYSALSKFIATIATYPMLTIKVKMQADKERTGKVIEYIMNLSRQLGLEGLYVGIFAKLVQTILYNSFMMVTYEKLRLVFKVLLIKYLVSRGRIGQ